MPCVLCDGQWRKDTPTLLKPCDSCGHKMYDCLVCNKYCNEEYFVTDEIWNKVAPPRHYGKQRGVIHLLCLQKQLGRELTIDDFPDVPINSVLKWAYTKGRHDAASSTSI